MIFPLFPPHPSLSLHDRNFFYFSFCRLEAPTPVCSLCGRSLTFLPTLSPPVDDFLPRKFAYPFSFKTVTPFPFSRIPFSQLFSLDPAFFFPKSLSDWMFRLFSLFAEDTFPLSSEFFFTLLPTYEKCLPLRDCVKGFFPPSSFTYLTPFSPETFWPFFSAEDPLDATPGNPFFP